MCICTSFFIHLSVIDIMLPISQLQTVPAMKHLKTAHIHPGFRVTSRGLWSYAWLRFYESQTILHSTVLVCIPPMQYSYGIVGWEAIYVSQEFSFPGLIDFNHFELFAGAERALVSFFTRWTVFHHFKEIASFPIIPPLSKIMVAWFYFGLLFIDSYLCHYAR